MNDIILAFAIFILSAGFHLGLCRWILPKRMPLLMAALIPVTMAGLAVYGIMAAAVYSPTGREVNGPLALPLSAGAFYVLLMTTYFVFFANAALESPSQAVVLLLRRRGRVTLSDLQAEISDRRFIVTRLDSLLRNHLVEDQQGRYRLTAKGKMTARWLSFYAWILGRKAGG